MNYFDQYTEANTVCSLVFYEWTTDLDMVGIGDLFEQVVKLVGRQPDIATVMDDQTRGKDYLYRNFVNRNVISRKEWVELGYLWKRGADVLSDFAIDMGCSIKKFRHFALHIDEASVDNSSVVVAEIVDVVVQTLQPLYGIGYSMPYFWGPQAFAIGQTKSRHADGEFYGAPEEIRRQSRAFLKTFLADAPERRLDVKLRDVFELNFLSEGHLSQKIEGLALGTFIETNGIGTLNQLTPLTWRWSVPRSEVQNVRKIMKNADFIVVKEGAESCLTKAPKLPTARN